MLVACAGEAAGERRGEGGGGQKFGLVESVLVGGQALGDESLRACERMFPNARFVQVGVEG